MELGPVQLMVVAFDEPNFQGEIAAELGRLSDLGLVRLLDAMVVDKADNGTVTTLRITELSSDEMTQLGSVIGALIGLGAGGEEGAELGAQLGADAAADGHIIDDMELVEVLDEVPPGSSAAIALIEHLWAVPFRDAIERSGGTPVLDMWVHPLDLVAIGADTLDDES
jgi:uncharacterized membrane protein